MVGEVIARPVFRDSVIPIRGWYSRSHEHSFHQGFELHLGPWPCLLWRRALHSVPNLSDGLAAGQLRRQDRRLARRELDFLPLARGSFS